MDLKELYAKFKEAQDEVMKLVDVQAEELKKFGDMSAETKEQMAKAAEQMEKADNDIKSFQERLDTMEKEFKQPGFGSGAEPVLTPGETVVKSEQFQRALSGNGKNMDAVHFKTFFPRKDVSTIVADGGYSVQPMRVPELYYDPGQRPSHIRDIMNIGTTQSNSVEFVRETLFTNNAAAVEEKSEYGKPQSDFTFELFNSPVSTIAHWVPATRQCLSDVPMMLSYINGRLVYGLKTAEDNDILFGTGLNGAMTGIMVTAGITAQPAAAAGDTNIDAIRRAMAAIRLAEYPATGVVLNPQDWAAIELTKEVGTLAYIWPNVGTGAGSRIWGIPVIESTAMPVGQFLVGAFGLGAQLWDREQANVRVSEHHEDYFTNNMVAILAEERLALTVYRPQAFCAGAF